MAIALILEFPGVAQSQYEIAGTALGDPRKHGALVHIAGPMEGGWRVVKVWPSQQAFQKVGIPPAQCQIDGGSRDKCRE